MFVYIFLPPLVIYFGNRLSQLSDIIGEKSGLGGAWVGLILVSAITSLPELVTSLGAIILLHQPDLAIGNIYGSNCFNVTIFALVILAAKNISEDNNKSNYQSIIATILLTIFSLIGLILGQATFPHTIIISLIIFAGYSFTIKTLSSSSQSPPGNITNKYPYANFKKTIISFIFNALIIVICGLWLVSLADKIAVYEFHLGKIEFILGQSLVGTILVAGSTSLPEIVISLSAIRRSSIGLALGNVLGSNLFNLVILSLADFFYKGQLYIEASLLHIIAGILSLILVVCTLICVHFYSRLGKLTAWGILLIYLVGMFIFFRLGIQV